MSVSSVQVLNAESFRELLTEDEFYGIFKENQFRNLLTENQPIKHKIVIFHP